VSYGLQPLFQYNQPVVQMGYIQASAPGLLQVGGTGQGGGDISTALPYNGSAYASRNSAAIMVTVNNDRQMRTCIGIGPWSTPPL